MARHHPEHAHHHRRRRRPQAAEINQTIEVAPIDTNLLLILDTSGSMNTGDGVGGTSRLATAISALNQLLDSYDNFGEVRVRLVAFSDVSSSRGSGWMAVSEAKALLAALTPAAAPTTMRRWPRPNPPSPPPASSHPGRTSPTSSRTVSPASRSGPSMQTRKAPGRAS
jgi:Mg-chelatase subunit ChlD